MFFCKVPLAEIPLALLAAFFSFNMHYPQGCTNFYTFFECFFMGKKTPNKKTRLASILAHIAKLSTSISLFSFNFVLYNCILLPYTLNFIHIFIPLLYLSEHYTWLRVMITPINGVNTWEWMSPPEREWLLWQEFHSTFGVNFTPQFLLWALTLP